MSRQGKSAGKGYRIQFASPRRTFSRLWEFQKDMKPTADWDKSLLKFAKEEFGIEGIVVEDLNTILTGGLVEPELANKIAQAFPDAKFETVFEGKYDVIFEDIEPIRELFKNFSEINEHKYTYMGLREAFVSKYFSFVIGGASLDRLLAGKPISNVFASMVLKLFPRLKFTLKAVRTGRPRALPPFLEVLSKEVHYGFLSLGEDDRKICAEIDDLLRGEGAIKVTSRPINPWQIGKPETKDLLFIANACFSKSEFPQYKNVCNTHNVAIVLIFSPSNIDAKGKVRSIDAMRIGVVQGSAEHAMCEELQFPDIFRIYKGNAVFQYDLLVQMVEEGSLDAALINTYSLEAVFTRRWALGKSRKNDPHPPHFDQAVARKFAVNGLVQRELDTALELGLLKTPTRAKAPFRWYGVFWKAKIGIYCQSHSVELERVFKRLDQSELLSNLYENHKVSLDWYETQAKQLKRRSYRF